MREDEIQRYGRQILLRELGGRGQQKLLDARVAVHGAGAALESAVTYLRAGGTPVERSEAPTVTLWSRELAAGGPRDGAVVVVGGNGVAWRAATACPACFERALAVLGAGVAPVVIGSLAALAVQRLIFGWAAPLGVVSWDGERLVSPRWEPCALHLQG